MKQVEIAKSLFRDFWYRAKKRRLHYTYEQILQRIFIEAANGENYFSVHQECIDSKTISALEKEGFICEIYKNNCRIVIPI